MEEGCSQVIILMFKLLQQLQGVEEKPPVTILLLVMNIVPHMYDIDVIGYSLSNIRQNCIHPRTIVTSLLNPTEHFPLHRIILPAFMHVDDVHLYYNMLSLCWKGEIFFCVYHKESIDYRLYMYTCIIISSFY